MKRRNPWLLIPAAITVAALGIGSFRDPNFWRTPAQRGDRLLREGRFAEAARAYTEPWAIGTAQYRAGDFEQAAKTFARVPGARGAFDQGNAWLMRGKYDAAIASYDRALGFEPGWRRAEENRAIATARKQALEQSGENRADEQADAYKPDDVVEDQKGEDQAGQPAQLTGEQVSDEELRATWLRRVQTTPGDFLRAKFAFQAAKEARP